jgi:hypothetical protein
MIGAAKPEEYRYFNPRDKKSAKSILKSLLNLVQTT